MFVFHVYGDDDDDARLVFMDEDALALLISFKYA
jgi:hypothetical protein